MDAPNTEDAFDPSSRRLCPDGACVGVIGDDGVCSECGRTEAQAAAGEEAAAVPPSPGAPSAGAPVEAGPDASVGFDPTSRRLCDDGACVGVVGDDGVCRVCGRRSE